MRESTSTLRRIAEAVPEARRDHRLSQRQLAALSGVSRKTIARLERGELIGPQLLMRLSVALLVLDAHQLPDPSHSAALVWPEVFAARREEVAA
jgi:transcriptional regulator with XRE-family HTH domain